MSQLDRNVGDTDWNNKTNGDKSRHDSDYPLSSSQSQFGSQSKSGGTKEDTEYGQKQDERSTDRGQPSTVDQNLREVMDQEKDVTVISKEKDENLKKGQDEGEQEKPSIQIDPYLDTNYSPRGIIQTLADGTQFYVVGTTESKKGVILISDLFGWNTGRTRALADYLADTGFYVMIPRLLAPVRPGTNTYEDDSWPNLFDFSRIGEYMKSLTYESNLKPKMNIIVTHMKNCGIQAMSILSYSWGGWLTAHLLSDRDLLDAFTCAAIAHPSIHLEDRVFGSNTSDLVSQIQKPMLFITTRDDPDEYRPGGAYFEPLLFHTKTSDVLDIPSVEHGFLPRGNIRYHDNYAAISKTMNKVTEFFDSHAQQIFDEEG